LSDAAPPILPPSVGRGIVAGVYGSRRLHQINFLEPLAKSLNPAWLRGFLLSGLRGMGWDSVELYDDIKAKN